LDENLKKAKEELFRAIEQRAEECFKW
jgi:hypothetical protein